MSQAAEHVQIENLTLAYGERIVQSHLSFDIHQGEVFIVMGGSGCGKSTLLRHMIGLLTPTQGRVCYHGQDYFASSDEKRQQMRRRWGVLFQGSALFSAMTLAENVALPLQQYTSLDEVTIRDVVAYKLSLVGLAGFEAYYPAELSGGMQTRAGLARALALDPEILFFDEPSSGLDPLSARRLDELIFQIRDTLGSTVVIVTHELASIFSIADRCVFLDAETHSMLDIGSPRHLRDNSPHERVRTFLNQGIPV
jgi:phospholipid/cholesterol/gamma-HCH transport system ATP-binding protein